MGDVAKKRYGGILFEKNGRNFLFFGLFFKIFVPKNLIFKNLQEYLKNIFHHFYTKKIPHYQKCAKNAKSRAKN
jgi:hypothetical protein